MSQESKSVLFRFLIAFAFGFNANLIVWLQSGSTDWRVLLISALATAGAVGEKIWANSSGPTAPLVRARKEIQP